MVECEKEYFHHRNTARLASNIQGPAIDSDFDFMY